MSQRVLRRVAAAAAFSTLALAGLAHAQGRPGPMTVSPGAMRTMTADPRDAQIKALQNEVVSLHAEVNTLTVLAKNQANLQSALSEQVNTLQAKFANHTHDVPTAGGSFGWVNPLECSPKPGGPGYNCTPFPLSVPGKYLGAGTMLQTKPPK